MNLALKVDSDPTGDPIADRQQALREAGTPRHAPVQWQHLQTLQARLPGLPPDVVAQLAPALERALLACEQARPPAPHPAPPPGRPVLAALTARLRERHEADARHHMLDGDAIDPSELDSLRRVRASCARLAVEDRLTQALRRTPDNAGPLNSHALVLRSLALMRELAPDYLQRFLTQMDALMWLEDLTQRPAHKTGKPARRPPTAKSRPEPA